MDNPTVIWRPPQGNHHEYPHTPYISGNQNHWATFLSLIVWVYLHSFSRCCLPKMWTSANTDGYFFFTARCTLVQIAEMQNAVLRSHVVCPSVCLSVCPSVTLVDHDHIGWKSWKLIAWTISPTPLLFVAKRVSTYSQRNMGKFWGD